jgi:8-oxo-dGTP diphosphatase
MARAPIMAAGGIVVRGGACPLIAVVQRRKDDAWVLPKGKLKPGETTSAAAQREATEETGHEVVVHEFLGALTYGKSRKPKVVQFWRMQANGASGRALMSDIRAVRWLPLKAAIDALDDPVEQVFLRHVGPRAVTLSRAGGMVEPAGAVAAAPKNAPADAETDAAASPEPTPPGEPEIRLTLLQRALQAFRRATSPAARD